MVAHCPKVIVLVMLTVTLGLLGAPAAWSDNEHVIGVDDLLQIQVWDQLGDKKEVDREVAVRLDGKISLPLVGEPQAAGLTASQLTDVLTKELSKTVKNPNVSVVVKEIRSLRVFLVGRVAKSGTYFIKPGTPVLQALTLAGGLVEGADLPAAYIVRGDQRVPLDLRRLIQEADLSQNVPLQPGDTLVVPDMMAGANPQEVGERRIYILGKVQKPGVYTIRQEIPVIQAIFLAGGLVEPAADLTGAFVIRGKQRLPVDLRRLIQNGDLSQNVMIRHEDTLVVPEGGDMQNSVFIMGEIVKPGAYARVEALTVMKLVSLAGGFTKFAAPSRITVIRENGVDGAHGAPKGKEKTRLRLNANAVERDPKGNPDISLEAGDIVIIPQTLF